MEAEATGAGERVEKIVDRSRTPSCLSRYSRMAAYVWKAHSTIRISSLRSARASPRCAIIADVRATWYTWLPDRVHIRPAHFGSANSS